MVIVLLVLSPGYGWSGVTIRVPKPFEVIDHAPVKLVIDLSRGIEPDSFQAWLNDEDITAAFQKENNTMIAVVSPIDGLRINVDSDSDGFSFSGLNFLKVQAKVHNQPGMTMDYRVFFVRFTGDTTYSGVYCVDLFDFEMNIYRQNDQVLFTVALSPDEIIEGAGKASENQMTLHTKDPEGADITLELEFSADGDSFIGSFTVEENGDVEQGPFNGQKGNCQFYGPQGDISMITPYVDEEDASAVTGGFSTTTNCPWGKIHDGIDIAPINNLMPFQAVADGIVFGIDKFLNKGNGFWQVNVRIRYNSAFNVEYAFEPMSPLETHGNQQLALIAKFIYLGKEVLRGEIIGELLSSEGKGAHVHFALRNYDDSICPEPYFTSDARQSVLNLLQNMYPTADRICYE
jgi:murein DD-endopeptidase MepM/ murein hydrolase activator NlpD